jgi:hypothetical protein
VDLLVLTSRKARRLVAATRNVTLAAVPAEIELTVPIQALMAVLKALAGLLITKGPAMVAAIVAVVVAARTVKPQPAVASPAGRLSVPKSKA